MATTSKALLLAALLASAPLAGQVVRNGPLPDPLPIFPADNWWNVDVSAAPADPTLTALYLAFIGNDPIHPDFGGDADTAPFIYGMPYIVVGGNQPLEPMVFDYAGESDYGAPGRPPGYPIPVEAKTQTKWIEGGCAGNASCAGDKHLLVVDRDNRLLFETWNTRCLPAGSPTCTWRAGSGAVFPLDTNQQRPDTWTSADAAGLAILPGLIRYDEAYGSEPIRHAFRVTFRDTNGYVYPASHEAGSNPNAPPMGARLRLKSNVTVASSDPGVQKIVQAMKTYGLIVADNGSDMYIQGTYDTRWDNGILNPALGQIHASDFEFLPLGWRPPDTMPAGPRALYTLAPCRLLDTRDSPGAYGAPSLYPLYERTFQATGRCGIPSTARAISGNVTVVNAGAAGNLRLLPGNVPAPNTSSLSFAAGPTRANNLIFGLSPAGAGTFTIANDASAPVDVLVDVNGYFQ